MSEKAPIANQYVKTDRWVTWEHLRADKVYYPNANKTPIRILSISPPNKIRTVDSYGKYKYRWLNDSDKFYLADHIIANPCSEITLPQKEKEPEMTNNAKLYEIAPETSSEEILYGTKLAVNSQGHWVMEIKGTGQVVTADPKRISVVTPYTIAIQFFDNSGTKYQYLAEKGMCQVGDVFVLDAPFGISMVVVVDVDTKSEKATKEFKPMTKVVTTPL